MKTVIIVSKCLANFPDATSRFHFKGVSAGEDIKDVILKRDMGAPFTVGSEYLMYVQLTNIKGGILTGTVIKSKLLEECYEF